MLATILKSKIAVKVSINIMDAFVAMRHYVAKDLLEQSFINKMVLNNHKNIKLLQESFSN